jgi:hypothetical protein
MDAAPPRPPAGPHGARRSDAPALAAAVEAMSATLALAHGLVAAGRRVDLQGLDGEMSAICDATLALPAEEARALLPRLVAVRAQIDELAAALPPP